MPGKLFNGKKYFLINGFTFRKRNRAEDQATRIRRSGYYVRVCEEGNQFVLYARTKNGRPIPKEWRKVSRNNLTWKV
jgi:hypothetical protein